MKKIKSFPIIILFSGLFAVINTFEDSYTRKNNIDTPFDSAEMPVIDVNELIIQDQNNSGPGVPMRFSYAFEVNLTQTPQINSISPSSAGQGESLNVTLSGSYIDIGSQWSPTSDIRFTQYSGVNSFNGSLAGLIVVIHISPGFHLSLLKEPGACTLSDLLSAFITSAFAS